MQVIYITDGHFCVAETQGKNRGWRYKNFSATATHTAHWGETPLLPARKLAAELVCLQTAEMAQSSESPNATSSAESPIGEETPKTAGRLKKKSRKLAQQTRPEALFGEPAEKQVQARGVEVALDDLDIGVGVEVGQVREVSADIWQGHMKDLDDIPPDHHLQVTVWNPSLADQSMLQFCLLPNRVFSLLSFHRHEEGRHQRPAHREGAAGTPGPVHPAEQEPASEARCCASDDDEARHSGALAGDEGRGQAVPKESSPGHADVELGHMSPGDGGGAGQPQ